MKLNNMKITTRLSATLGLLVTILLGLAALALWQMGTMRQSTQAITENWLPSVELVNSMNTDTSDYRIGEISHVLATDAQDMERLEKEMAEVKAKFDKSHDAYVKLISSDEERKLYETFAADWKAYLQLHDQLLAASRNNETDKARTILDKESKPVFERASATLLKLIELNHNGSVAESKAADEAYESARNETVAGVLGALAVAVVAGIWLVRSIGGPLRKAVTIAESVAAGDFTNAIETDGEDEAAQVLKALARMQSSLIETVSSVRMNAEGVATASSQIAQGNQDLSQRTEEQASALEETAASMEQLSSTVKQNADNALQANQLAMGASTVAIKGGEVVSEVVTTMKSINDSSKRIADIISVIDGIAFQTNILALNAAVEAARAGEQGRGFAVVASEVRNLAGRSAEAAKEIKSLIMASVERVDQGTALVDQAGVTMTEVVGAIQRVTQIMGEISAASAEQSAGVSQVGDAVSQMDQVTQQNAALVEESAAAASSLNSQAHALVESVAFFKLAHRSGAAMAPAPAPATHATASEAPHFVERRGPNRATNVTRPQFGAKARATGQTRSTAPAASAKTGTDDWENF